MDHEHILVLGATGASGIAFIEAVAELTHKPKLTLYVRPGSRSKLPADSSVYATGDNTSARIIEGHLDDKLAMQKALSASDGPSSFPPVSVVVSFLGSYVSFKAVFTRDKSHPIADAFSTAIMPAMKALRITRILALSTPSALPHPSEGKTMPWKWWLYTCMPILLAPQGNAEMKGIAQAIIDAGSGDDPNCTSAIEWTVFRVPHLTQGDRRAKVVAGLLDQDFAGSLDLSRGSLVRWVLGEIQDRKFLRQLPMLANP
ncbi:hypothetical protein RBB50_012716 [Rhinocladiella similis]